MGDIKKYLASIQNLKVGNTEINKVCKGTTVVWERIVELNFDPDYLQVSGPAPVTTSETTAINSGDIYLTGAGSQYMEVEWYKNGSYQGYMYIFDGSNDNYPNGRTFAVANGDKLKFRFSGGPGSDASLTFDRDDSAGEHILTVTGLT